jgi:hypothetical protein
MHRSFTLFLNTSSHVSTSQVDDSDHQIPRDPAGKMRESHRILQGKHRKSLEHGSSIPTRHYPDFFQSIPVLSGKNRPKITGKNPKSFRMEYCFHKTTRITRNWLFLGRTVRTEMCEPKSVCVLLY